MKAMVVEKIGSCATLVEAATASALCHEIYERFSDDPDLLAIPVVNDGTPIGLVHREDFLVRFADTFGRALYEAKTVVNLMDQAPLIFDSDHSIDFVSHFVSVERPSALLKGFIVIRDNVYAGIVTGINLLQATLERQRRHAQELAAARIAAEDASRAKSNFLAMVSHELRTPLNAIIGFSNFILSEPYGAVAPAQYKEYVVDISTSGGHLLRLINDILDMARIESGRYELNPELISMVEIIEMAVHLLRTQVENANHTLRLELNRSLPLIKADERAMRQIMMNLLSNAIKFTPPGGKIIVRAAILDEGQICLEVEDSGIGIPAESIEKVMQPFGQVDSSLSRSHEGTGLGLPIVKGLIEAHGGAFSLISKPNTGTRAIITLPFVVAEETPIFVRAVAAQ